jgi:hypothetical protein
MTFDECERFFGCIDVISARYTVYKKLLLAGNYQSFPTTTLTVATGIPTKSA